MNDNYVEYVDSDYRISGHSSNFLYRIQVPRKFNRCCVLSASVPKTWYMIQSGYNTFTVTEASGTRTITLPTGDYTKTNFSIKLIELLNTGGIGYTYAISQPDTHTSKFTYSVSNNSSYQPTFTFPNSSVVYRLMGFEYASTNTFASSSLVSDNIPFFQHTNTIFLRSNLQKNENSSLSGDILCQMNCINIPQLTAVNYAAIDILRQSKPFNSGSDTFNFRITDADGFELDLNGIPLNLEIAFYNLDDTNEIIKGKAILDNLQATRDDMKRDSDRKF